MPTFGPANPAFGGHEGDQGPRILRRLIGALQAAMCRRDAAASALWVAAAGLVFLTALLATDAAVRLPGLARAEDLPWRAVVYPLAVLAVGGAVAAAAARAWLKRPSAAYLARLIEAQVPELKESLTTFVELEGDPASDQSMGLAVARRAARILGRCDPQALLPPDSLRRPVLAVAAAALVLAAGLWLCQGVLIAPWAASAEAGLARAGAVGPGPPQRPGSPAAAPDRREQVKAESQGAASHVTNDPSAGRRPSAVLGAVSLSNGGDRASDAGEPVPSAAGDISSESAAAQALASALQAEAGKFERLAAALAAGGASKPGGASAGDGAAGSGGAEARSQGATSSPGPGDAGTPQAAGRPPDASRGSAVAGGTGSAKPRGNSAESAAAQGSDSAGTTQDGEATGPDAGLAGRSPPLGRARGREPVERRRPRGDGETPGAPAGNSANPGVPRGGGPGDGSAKPPASAAGDPPLPRFKPSEEFPEHVLDAMRRARRLLEEADRRLRDGEVTDAFLDRMGMGNAEFRRFVVAWQRQLETAAAGPDVTAPPTATRAAAEGPAGEWLHPAGGTAARPIVGPMAVKPDGEQGLVQGGSTRVSPRLRPAVAAYFEAVGRIDPKRL